MPDATFRSSPARTVLNDLFAASERVDRPLLAQFASLPAAEQAAFLADHHTLYAVHAKDAYLPVSRATGELLYLLARARRPSTIVEFGTSFGVSTIFLASALRDQGHGRLVGTELTPTKAARARANVAAAGLGELVEIREGDALETLRRELPGPVGFFLLDGAKALYADVLRVLAPSLEVGAIVVADNADMDASFRAELRASAAWLTIPWADDLEVSMWLGDGLRGSGTRPSSPRTSLP